MIEKSLNSLTALTKEILNGCRNMFLSCSCHTDTIGNIRTTLPKPGKNAGIKDKQENLIWETSDDFKDISYHFMLDTTPLLLEHLLLEYHKTSQQIA